jgi:hypothetical protein
MKTKKIKAPTVKKLTLSKQSLRNLTVRQLEHVAGGTQIHTQDCHPTGNCTG